MIRVAIVDDHDMMRVGVKYVLGLTTEFSVVGESRGAEDLDEFVLSCKPDVLLLDVNMPGRDGIAALEEIRAARPDQKVVMLTVSDAEENVFAALKGGAKGYVLKDAETDDIMAAIRTVAAGGEYLPESIRRVYETRRASPGLSPREREVLQLVVRGFHNREIADMLNIGENGVKKHLKGIFAKLDVATRTEAASAAIERGIV